MRVFYVDMHCNSFIVDTASAMLIKKRLPKRHREFIKYLLKNDVEVINIVTDNGSTLPNKGIFESLKKRKNHCIREAEYVLKKNGLEGVKSVNDLYPREKDILIMYSHFGIRKELLKVDCIKIVDFTHFYGNRTEAATIEKWNPNAYLSEIDLFKYSRTFIEYYSHMKNLYKSRPYSFEDRFQSKIPFSERKNKVCAMGNIAGMYPQYKEHRDFIQTYNCRFMQPQRKMFYDHQSELSDIMDCYSTIGDNRQDQVEYSEADFYLVKEFKWWRNYFVGNRYSKYYKEFDMVDTYNQYKMVVNAEDANGIYAIGAIEAMACGCVLIGRDYGVYEDLGLANGTHYISYDGSLEDFRAKVDFYLRDENASTLENISEAGRMYVAEHYSDEVISKRYYEILKGFSR